MTADLQYYFLRNVPAIIFRIEMKRIKSGSGKEIMLEYLLQLISILPIMDLSRQRPLTARKKLM